MDRFELVEITTKDNLIHQGIFARPERAGNRALLWVHGLTGRFYGDVTLMNLFAGLCRDKHMGFASFNTRGHDIITGINTRDPNEPFGTGHTTVGAGMEVFEDSVHDIDAGITFLTDQGFSEVVLAGHSTGANKVCYYAATQNDPRVRGIILAGPLSDRLSEHVDHAEYENNITMLKMLRDEGKGDALLTKINWFPLTADRAWSLIAPNTNEDIFNYADEADTLTRFATVKKPVLVILAEQDASVGMNADAIRTAFDSHTGSADYTSIIIPDTDHGYTGKERDFVTIVTDWAGQLA